MKHFPTTGRKCPAARQHKTFYKKNLNCLKHTELTSYNSQVTWYDNVSDNSLPQDNGQRLEQQLCDLFCDFCSQSWVLSLVR